jgi:hypothetical protein
MTVELIDDKFSSIHEDIIESLRKQENQLFLYLEAFLKIKEKQIHDAIKEYSF